ncbi:autotransporter outer membrane beta-barrel domain-containing protein [Citrobacter youngae]|uniref:autotransporter outer membrane beta-barrel domain-containing protein n=1 Tax=Citrobacter youngae TaxID=133448 RepID=UPI0002F82CD7|nr:autotransporter outer membrane beta-barrel domain-containing protein [Citrobacter youngae]
MTVSDDVVDSEFESAALYAHDGGGISSDGYNIQGGAAGSAIMASGGGIVNVTNATLSGNVTTFVNVDSGGQVALGDIQFDAGTGHPSEYILETGTGSIVNLYDTTINNLDTMLAAVSDNAFLELGNVQISAVSGSGASMIDAQSGSSIQLSQSSLSADGSDVISLDSSSSLNVNDSSLSATDTSGSTGYTVVDLKNNANMTAYNTSFTLNGTGFAAISAIEDSLIDLSSDSVINVQGSNTSGVYLMNNSQLQLFDSTINVTGDNNYAINDQSSNDKTVLQNATINTTGSGNTGLYATGNYEIDTSNIAVDGASSYGITGRGAVGGIVGSTITASGDNSSALLLDDATQTLVLGSKLESQDAAAIVLEDSYNGKTDLTLSHTRVVGDSGLAIQAQDDTANAGTLANTVNVDANAGTTIDGDVVVQSTNANSTFTLGLTNSTLTGAIDAAEYAGTAIANIDANSLWTVTGDSTLNQVNNDGTIALTADTDSYSTLHADDLTLASTSTLDVDLGAAEQASDAQQPLITTGNATLAGNLNISNSAGNVPNLDSLTSDKQLQSVTLIDSDTAITTNFDSLTMDAGVAPDYLTIGGQVNPNDNTQYDLSVGLSWFAGGMLSASPASGTFTLDAGKSFEVTSDLYDVSATSDWDGKTLTKKGDGTLILSGDNTYSGGTDIQDGELVAASVDALGSGDIDNSGLLTLDADGAFMLSQNLVTEEGATTNIDRGSTLQVNTLTQESGSTLGVYLDLASSQPVITANQADLNGGTLNITGISDDPSHAYTGSVTVIDAAQPISGDFDSLTIAGAPASEVDFLNVEGRVDSNDNTNYDLTFGLTWYADSYNSMVPADGSFTIADKDQSFTLGTVLQDVSPNSVSNWDGKTLTKKGDGTLILDANNTYSGTTYVQDGTLWLDPDASIGAAGSQQQVEISQGATFGGSDAAVVNGSVQNDGTLRFDDTFTINGDVTNSGAIASALPGTQSGSDAQPDNTLVINGNYTGNGGSLTLNTYLGDDTSPTDKMVVNGNTSGDTTLYINQAGGGGAQTTDGIEVVQVNGESDGVFTQGNQVQAGLYEYRLYQDDSNGDWYLRSQSTDPDNGGGDDGGNGGGDDGGNGGGDNGNTTPQYRADIGAYLGNQWMARSLQMQTLYDREGSQYHNADGSVWARFKAGSADSQAAGGNVDIDNNYSQFQLGGDVLTWHGEEQSLTAGVMGSYINADTDSTGNRGADGSRFSANGNVKGYNLGIYATWFANAKTHNGAYVDSWYQYGTYSNHVDDGDVGSQDYDSTANAVSMEMGYRYDIALANQNLVSLTPQAQVVWQNYQADSVTDNSGTRIDGQNSDSWTTRLGLRVDSSLRKDEHATIQPFAEVNWLHTNDDTSVSFDNAEVKQDLPDNRAELKVGIQANINQQWSVTAQAAGQTGNDNYSDLNGSLNVRYRW